MHLSHEYHYQYTRYADDLTFSFKSSFVFLSTLLLRGKLKVAQQNTNVITDFHGTESFEINEDKSFYSCSFSNS